VLDLAIRGGRIVDGTGAAARPGDVGIAGDRIVAIGAVEVEAARTIDAAGLLVCPGFIDMHTHSDLRVLSEPSHEAKVCQGVTLEVCGQDGLSYAPVDDATLAQLRVQLAGWNGDPTSFDWSWRSVAEYLDRLDESRIAVNVAYLAPHGAIRMLAMGSDDRPPTDAELAEMRRLVRVALDDGAFGLSAGLTYAPGMYASDDEIVALLEPVRERGGFYSPHHRNYGLHAIEAYADSIEIARRADVPLHLAHAHLGFAVNRGRADELLRLIDESAVDISLDTYPYLAGATYLHALLPSWAHAGGATLARLRDFSLRERMRIEVEEAGSDGFHGIPVDWSLVVVDGEPVGAKGFDWVCETLVERELDVGCITHTGNEENVRTIMQHDCHTVGSDGILVGTKPHPRAYGTFPRYFAVYVRELGVLGWEQTVRKMTGLPALGLGLADRGTLREGAFADVTCVDPERVRDTATYEAPRQLPDGIPFVVVNGEVAVDNGVRTDALAGRALRSRR
jgi:N-acyl-D-amino-acid deacylase